MDLKMFKFSDLTRSGTAPLSVGANSKSGSGESTSIPAARVPLRPNTRGADGDLQELNINLKMNRRNYASQAENNEGVQEDFGYIQAIESFQAAIEDWTDSRVPSRPTRGDSGGQTESPLSFSSSSGVAGQSAAYKHRPDSRSVRKTGPSGLSAYTQDVANMVINNARTKSVRPVGSGREGRTGSDISKTIKSQNLSSVVAAYGSVKPTSSQAKARPPRPAASKHEEDSSRPTTAAMYSQSARPELDARRPLSVTTHSPREQETRRGGKTSARSPLLGHGPNSPKGGGKAQYDANKPSKHVDRGYDRDRDGIDVGGEEDYLEDGSEDGNAFSPAILHYGSRDTDPSPGIYVDDVGNLDESFGDPVEFNRGLSSAASDATFGYPMGDDESVDGDGAGSMARPQSRKLYLGTGGGGSSNSVSATTAAQDLASGVPQSAAAIEETRRKTPQSAGNRSVAMYPDVSIGSLRRIPSMKGSIPQWSGVGGAGGSGDDGDENQEDGEVEEEVEEDLETSCDPSVRPPSRQRSAFPVHLVDSTEVAAPNSSSVSKSAGGSIAVATQPIKLMPSSSPLEVDTAVESLERSLSHVSLQLQRPPSRQKIAAQHLFDHSDQFVSSQSAAAASGVEPTSLRRSSSNRGLMPVDDHSRTRAGSFLDIPDLSDSIAPVTAVGSARKSQLQRQAVATGPSTAPSPQMYKTARVTRANDPASDGFLDIAYQSEDVPFQIVVNRPSVGRSPAEAIPIPLAAYASSLSPSLSFSPPYGDISDSDVYDGAPAARSYTAPGDGALSTPKLTPLMPPSSSGRRPQPAPGLSASPGQGSSGSLRPGRRLNSNWAAGGSSPVYTSTRNSGGWMNAEDRTNDPDRRSALGSGNPNTMMRKLSSSPSANTMSAVSLMSQSQSQSHVLAQPWDRDEDCLTEASQSHADLESVPSMLLLSLESSLDEDFLSLFAPGI